MQWLNLIITNMVGSINTGTSEAGNLTFYFDDKKYEKSYHNDGYSRFYAFEDIWRY